MQDVTMSAKCASLPPIDTYVASTSRLPINCLATSTWGGMRCGPIRLRAGNVADVFGVFGALVVAEQTVRHGRARARQMHERDRSVLIGLLEPESRLGRAAVC